MIRHDWAVDEHGIWHKVNRNRKGGDFFWGMCAPRLHGVYSPYPDKEVPPDAWVCPRCREAFTRAVVEGE